MWPMIVLRTPKGWTGPKAVDGLQTEGSWRSHQVPLANLAGNPEHLKILEQWLQELSPRGAFRRERQAHPGACGACPEGRAPHGRKSARQRRRIVAGFEDARLSRLRRRCPEPRGSDGRSDTRHRRLPARRDEAQPGAAQLPRSSVPTKPSRTAWAPCSKSPTACSPVRLKPSDTQISPEGRVMEVLSEHLCQGWLEGYLLTGRHGFFSCYEAFIHIVDSMFNQHAKWLKVTRETSLAAPDRVAQLSAHLPRLAAGPQRLQPSGSRLHRSRGQQESRRDPRLSAARCEHAAVGHRSLPAQPQLRQRDRRGQAAGPAVARHGLGGQALHGRTGHLAWASNDEGGEPDVVMACAGDVPTLETLAAVDMLREHVPELKIRVINVVDLMALQPQSEHPHGLTDKDFDSLFTTGQADHLRLPRLSLAHPPADLSPDESRQSARSRLQRRGHDDDAVRHGRAESTSTASIW